MAVLYGPVQMVMIGLENDKLRGKIAHELHRASENSDIRVLDALAIQKTKDGDIVTLGASDLTPDQRVEYGAIIGGLMGFGATGTEEGLESGAEIGVEAFATRNFGLSSADVRTIAADVPPGMTVVIVLLEHRWAIPLKEELVNAGGVVFAQGMIQPEAIMAFGSRLADGAIASQDSQTSESGQIH